MSLPSEGSDKRTLGLVGSDLLRTGGRTFKKNTGTAIPTGLSGLAVYVLDRSANSHRKTSSPVQTIYETHTVASQKQLGVPESLEKVIPIPRSLHPIYNGGWKKAIYSQANHYTQ